MPRITAGVGRLTLCAAALMHGICRCLRPLLQNGNNANPTAVSLALNTRHGRRHSATTVPIDAYTKTSFATVMRKSE